MTESNRLLKAIATVVTNELCSGCGLCTRLRPGVAMALDARGYTRPQVDAAVTVSDAQDARDAQAFSKSCPGVRVAADRAPDAVRSNPTFGPYVQAWQAWAVDPTVRHAGSSGGVLTALSQWLLTTGQVDGVLNAGPSPTEPTATAAERLRDPAAVRDRAGSRYAPVGVLGTRNQADDAVVAKPCEAAALRAAEGSATPVLLSFFCAGTPSQHATDRLATSLLGDGVIPTSVRYRGNGWPGEFVVEAPGGSRASASYEASWGQHLGRTVQWRCKLCVDGTGSAADISVGDYWLATDTGYPTFDDAPGRSIVLARTGRGLELVLAAAAAGVIELADVDVADAERGQPLQEQRRRTLFGRLLGTRAAGRRVPSYGGWRLWRFALRHPRANMVAARRSFGRARQNP